MIKTKEVYNLIKNKKKCENISLGSWVYKCIEGEYWNDYTLYYIYGVLVLKKDTTIFKSGTTKVIRRIDNRIMKKVFLDFSTNSDIMKLVNRCKNISHFGE